MTKIVTISKKNVGLGVYYKKHILAYFVMTEYVFMFFTIEVKFFKLKEHGTN
jgi:hypothetical protein